MERISVAIRNALRRSNLPVEVARFHGEPSTLIDEDGRVLSPIELDERRDTARVAMLTDGSLLVGRLHHGRTRAGLGANLRMLARWPALCVFEFGTGHHRLRAALERYSIDVKEPQELVPWLGGVAAANMPRVANDLTLWAAACSLAPVPVDLDTALALRRHLRLKVPAWEVRALANEAGQSGRLWWLSPRRERLMSWLAEVESNEALAAIRAFWVDHFEQAARQEPGAPSERWDRQALPEAPQTPQWHAMMACATLVRLWTPDPSTIDGVVPEVHHFRDSAESIVRQLQSWAPIDGDVTDRARLPWAFADLQPLTRHMLRELQMGGLEPHPPERLKRPGRSWVALGVALTTLVAAAMLSIWPPAPPPDQRPGIPKAIGPAPTDAVLMQDRIGRRRLWYSLDPKTRTVSSRVTSLRPGHILWFDWRNAHSEPCQQRMEGFHVWLCGRNENPPRGADAPSRSVFVLDGKPEMPPAQALAWRLLSTGAADQVWFVPRPLNQGARHVSALESEVRLDRGQVVVVTRELFGSGWSTPTTAVVRAPDWHRLRRALGGRGYRPIRGIWSDASVEGDAVLPGTGCAAGDRRRLGGIWARCVPEGTHRVSMDGEEGLLEPVHVRQFWIAETETTYEQARRGKLEAPGSGDQPVVGVTWRQAQMFCASVDGRLPSSAEWEIAARAGTTSAWSSGSRVALHHFSAWFDEGGAGIQRSGRKKANGWGVHDMSGNAREWVRDAYRGVQAAPGVAAERRVVRGGSIESSAWQVRSASRSWHYEDSTSRMLGFRCAWDEDR